MGDKEIMDLYNNTTARDRNRISTLVSCRVPKEEPDLNNTYEEMYFDLLMEQAEAHLIKYGFWPTYEMEELDYDDIPDIYSNTAEEWYKERHKSSVENTLS